MVKKISVKDYIEKAPISAAIQSKLITDKKRQHHGLLDESNLNLAQIDKIVNTLIQKEQDVENILKLFPDTELGISILVSSIISPKDMVSNEITYVAKKSNFPSDMQASLLEAMKEELEEVYKIEENLPDLIRDVLFYKGSYVQLIIPENVLDSIINDKIKDVSKSRAVLNEVLWGVGSVESNNVCYKNIAFLKGKESEKDTSLREVLKVDISDNFWAIKTGDVNDKINTNAQSASLETVYRTDSYRRDKYDNLYKNLETTNEKILSIDDYRSDRASIGRPFRKTLPSTAVIPIYSPDSPDKHHYYYIVVDQDGYPVTPYSNTRGSELVNVRNDYSTNLMSQLTNEVKSQLGGNCDEPTIDQMGVIYSRLVEEQVIKNLSHVGRGLKADLTNELYDIMFARALANRYTRLICVPAEFISYTAVKYHPNGVGKTLFDNLKILSILRAVSLFTKLFAMMKNATTQTKVNMKLDANDPNVTQTIEDTQHEVMKALSKNFRLDSTDPNDIVHAIRTSGVSFSFEGHPKIPDTQLDFENTTTNMAIPDMDFDQHLADKTIQSMWLTPEIVEQGLRGDSQLATSITFKNLNLTKRVLQVQKPIMRERTNYARLVCKHDHILRNRLKKIIYNNRETLKGLTNKDFHGLLDKNDPGLYTRLLDDFIETVELQLPKPDTTTLEGTKESFSLYRDAVEDALNEFLSEDIVSEGLMEELGMDVNIIKANWKSVLLRDWMSDHNYLPEVSTLVSPYTDKGSSNTLLDAFKPHLLNIVRTTNSFSRFIAEMNKDTGIESTDETPADSDDDAPDSTENDDGVDTTEGTDDNDTETSQQEEENVDDGNTKVDNDDPDDFDNFTLDI